MSLPSRKRGLKYLESDLIPCQIIVASLAEAWIEIELKHHPVLLHYVASLAEAWIEMLISLKSLSPIPSLPSRKRGLKYAEKIIITSDSTVASLAEAWIEIPSAARSLHTGQTVASLAEAWIEILWQGGAGTLMESLPSRKRGLKSVIVGAVGGMLGRFPRGSVD